MKVVLRVVAMAAVFCVMPLLHAADVSGTWKGSFEFNGSPVPLTFDLKADGNTLTGTIEGLPTTPAEIHDGKITGDEVDFWVNTDYQGQTYKLVYKGKVAADHIDFDFGTDDGSWGATVTAAKAGAATPAATIAPAAPATAAAPAVPATAATPSAVDVTGAWKGTFDYEGNPMALTFNLKSDGATVTGNVEGMGAAPVEIHDGKIAGDTVTFWLNTDYQGQTYALTYKGKVSGGQIDFNFGIADGSWGTTVTVKKI